jgi:hypothetical protein
MLGISGLGFPDFSGLESILYLLIRFGNDFCDDHAGDPRPSINGHRGALTPENSKVWGAVAWSAPEDRFDRPVIFGEAHGRDATPELLARISRRARDQ